MAVQRLLSTARQFSAPAAIVLSLVCHAWSAEPEQKTTSAETTAARLVRAALENEVAGNNQCRDALLRQALSDSPNDAPAHWQLGQVRVQGKWQSLAEVEQTARQDKRLAEYGRLRDAARRTVADQAALARWCRKNRLEDQQRVQWQIVLQLQPDNIEAIRALRLRPYRGMMLTPAQIEQLKTQQQRVWKATEQLAPPGGPMAQGGGGRRSGDPHGSPRANCQDQRRGRDGRPRGGPVAAGRRQAAERGCITT